MKRIALIILIIGSCLVGFSQQNAKAEWQLVQDKLEISKAALLEIAPSFPTAEEYSSDEKFANAVHAWRLKNESEWQDLDYAYGISDQFSVVFLGVYTPEEYQAKVNNQFQHAWVQWIEGSGISDRRMNEVAPHFPMPKAGATANDKPEYEMAFEMWRILYGHEYIALKNAPELMALAPVNEMPEETVFIPKYIRGVQTEEFPEYVDTGNPAKDELSFALEKQSWYFIYDLASFKRIYGFEPVLPVDFDAEAYRAAVLYRIEMDKKIKSGEVQATSDF